MRVSKLIEAMDICNITLWFISATLIVMGVGVVVLVFRARGVNAPSDLGRLYHEGKADFIWTMAPFTLILELVVAVAFDNRC